MPYCLNCLMFSPIDLTDSILHLSNDLPGTDHVRKKAICTGDAAMSNKSLNSQFVSSLRRKNLAGC
jgi:hypothetical protein